MQRREPISPQAAELEPEIRRRAQAAARHVTPVQAANLFNGVAEEERVETLEDLTAGEQMQRDLHERFPRYFEAADAVRDTEAETDLPRFRAWRKEQRRLAREADSWPAGNAARIRTAGGILLAAAVLTRPFDLISADVFYTAGLVGAALLVLGTQLLKKRRSPLWNGAFADPKLACAYVWGYASQAAAVALIRAREPDAAEWETAMRRIEAMWERRNRRSNLWAEEDYTGIRYTSA